MTEKQKKQLLKSMRHKKLNRTQIEKFCTGETSFEREHEINSLCAQKLICMTSNPTLISGVFVPKPEDIFKLADSGLDYLNNIKKERFRTYLPIGVSIASLLVSIIAILSAYIK